MKKALNIILMFGLLHSVRLAAQSPAKINVKYFTKEKKIVFRMLPRDKKVFDEMNDKSIDIVRYENAKGILSNSVTVKSLLRSYYEGDTLNWMRLFRKDKDKAGFIYSALYPRKTNEKLSLAEREKFDKMSFDLIMLSCALDHEIAGACGLLFTDSTVNKDKTYTYIFSIHTNSTSINTQSVLALNIDASVQSENVSINKLKGKSKNGVCALSWKALEYTSEYSGYNIYRSSDSVNYKKVNRAPVILLSSQFEKNKQFIYYNDSMPEHKKKFYYRIRGINYFGEECTLSNIVTVFSSPIIRSVPLIDTLRVISNKNVRLSWRMENQVENNLPEQYIVLKSNKEKGLYTKVFETSDKYNFTDYNVTTTSYYKIVAITNNKQDSIFSFSRDAVIIDTIAPQIVKNIKATVDKKGNVLITWSKNKEEDLLGYKVFSSNRIEDEFVQLNVTYITDTFYRSKLNLKTLSKKVYYKLSAADRNHNNSVFSDFIEVSRPDTIPPAPPILVSVSQEKNNIRIKCALSSSDDVVKQVLMRKSGNGEYSQLFSFLKNDAATVVLDSLIEPGKSYTYKLQATDENGNVSFSKEIEYFYETGFRKKIEDITYKVDRTLKEVFLTWKYGEGEIEKYILYRSRKDEKPTIIKTLPGTISEFTDKTLNMGNLYEYRIKAILVNGAESIISAPVKVQY